MRKAIRGKGRAKRRVSRRAVELVWTLFISCDLISNDMANADDIIRDPLRLVLRRDTDKRRSCTARHLQRILLRVVHEQNRRIPTVRAAMPWWR